MPAIQRGRRLHMQRSLLSIFVVAAHLAHAYSAPVELDVITPATQETIHRGEVLHVPVLVRVNTPDVNIDGVISLNLAVQHDADAIWIGAEVHNPTSIIPGSPTGDLIVHRWQFAFAGDVSDGFLFQGLTAQCFPIADVCTGVGELGRQIDPGYDPVSDTFDFAWISFEGRKRGHVDVFLTIGANGIAGHTIPSTNIDAFFKGEGPLNASDDRLVPTNQPQFRIWVVPEPRSLHSLPLDCFPCCASARHTGLLVTPSTRCLTDRVVVFRSCDTQT